MENRIEMVQSIIKYGKQQAWMDYAIEYDINDSNGNPDARKANDYWRYYERTGKVTPEIENTQMTQDTTKDLLSNARITKAWGKPGNLSYSYELKNNEEQVNFRDDLLNDLKKFSPKVSKIESSKLDKPIYYEISLPDLHFGKENIAITSDNFRKAVHKLVDRVRHLEIERFILPIGNDLLNSEGLRRSTTKGTPQFDYADWRETFRPNSNIGWNIQKGGELGVTKDWYNNILNSYYHSVKTSKGTKLGIKLRDSKIKRSNRAKLSRKKHKDSYIDINKGSKNPKALLTEEQVREIKCNLLNTDLKSVEIAKLYNVKPHVISFIKNNKNWKHVICDSPDHK